MGEARRLRIAYPASSAWARQAASCVSFCGIVSAGSFHRNHVLNGEASSSMSARGLIHASARMKAIGD